MNNTEEKNFIPPIKYDLDSKFKFECNKNLECFTRCCRGINIILTPYDILMLKNKLEISSDEFLAIYTKPELLENTDLPIVTLKLLDDERQSCPFVRDDGCLVYDARPSTCRYYPVGTASLSHKEKEKEEFYFFIKEEHCKGHQEKKDWTIKEWREDQKVDLCDEINNGWVDLVVRKRTFTKEIKFTEKAKKLFFMASYNVDAFKRFVFESDFLKKYDISQAEIDKIKASDIELLKFSSRWLKWVFYKVGDFKVKE